MVMKNTQHMEGKLEPKCSGSCTVIEVKENNGYIVKDKYSRVI